MNRQEILKAAEDCICRDRNATHGAPENSFGAIARLWSARLGIHITPAKAAILLSDLKTVRAWDNPDHDDNWVDGAGYMACGGELAAKDKEASLAKPMFAIGQVWGARNGTRFKITNINGDSKFPIVGDGGGRFRVTWTIDGKYWAPGVEFSDDLVRLISEPEDAA
jgi:hypothetical protein